MREILVLPIRLYQVVGSPVKNALLGSAGRCRFHPTCSSYAIESIRRFGCWRGSWLALCRLGRCHPWGGAGDDPVPPSTGRSPRGKKGGGSRDHDPICYGVSVLIGGSFFS